MRKSILLSSCRYIRRNTNVSIFLLFFFVLMASLAYLASKLVPNTEARAAAAIQQTDHGASSWQDIDEKSIPAPGTRSLVPNKYRTLRLNRDGLSQLLKTVPLEQPGMPRGSGVQIALPMPDGGFANFLIVESPIMEAGLARQFPEIRTYRGQGIDDPSATIRFIVTPLGFHAIVLTAEQTILIDPYSKGDADHYIAYKKRDLERKDGVGFQCLADEVKKDISPKHAASGSEVSIQDFSPIGDTLRRYRLAIAATGEYTTAKGGPTNAVMAISTAVSDINAIYERELAVHLDLVANEMSIMFTDAVNDGYTDGVSCAMRPQNQANLDAVIGNANYDIGFVFGGVNGDGGCAGIRVACKFDDGSPFFKAWGAVCVGSAGGTIFEVEFVSHEMGHQFGADHTFNAQSGFCGSVNGANPRAPFSAFEPGAGSTIMAYVHKCDPQNTQGAVDNYFHTRSLEQMLAHINGNGNCYAFPPPSTGNHAPSVNAGPDYTIPRATPFTLTASGSDPDLDPVFYNWEEYDLNSSSPPDTDADGRARPVFRSRPATVSPSRTFPSLPTILDYANVPPNLILNSDGHYYIPGEVLPVINRTMNFRVTARDNRSGGGGVSCDSMLLNVASSAGPFYVTGPNTSTVWAAGPANPHTVTWNVANTTASPVNCSTVKISLSTDGGATFPAGLVLAPATANDGSESVIVPANVSSTQARIKVEAVGNIFFDVSDTNFIIPAGSCSYSISPLSRSDLSVSGTTKKVTVTTGSTCGWLAKSNVDWITFKVNNVSQNFIGGTGTADISYDVAPNPNGAFRTGTISVAGQTHTVTQNPGCSVTINPSSDPFGSSGGTGRVDVAASSSTCNWTASSNVPWIAIISGRGGQGNGAVMYSVAPNNTGSSRNGTLNIGASVFTVTQNNADAQSPLVAFITCDNGYDFYFNGSFRGSGADWVHAQTYNLAIQPGRNVVAIRGTDAGGIAALLAELQVSGRRIGTSVDWRVSVNAPGNWADVNFDDSGWSNATEYGNYGVGPWGTSVVGIPGDTRARWIWSSNGDGDDLVYFRFSFNGAGGNAPPTVNITSPANGANFTAPANITVSANANDSDGTVTSVEFFQNSISIGVDTTSPFSVPWNNVPQGNYSLTAKATDNLGAFTVSNPVNVTVSPPGGSTLSAIVTCDNAYDLYFNGSFTGSGTDWTVSQTYNLQMLTGTNVVAIRCTDAGGIAGLLAELQVSGQRIGSSASWKVSLSAPPNWADVNFDDSGWSNATEYGSYGVFPWNTSVSGMPGDTPARWIWSSNSDADNLVYVRVTLGSQGPPTNFALNKPATQSSTPIVGACGVTAPAALAVDGNTNGNFSCSVMTVSHTDFEFQAWWHVDLTAVRSLQTVNIYNRTDCCSDRLKNYYVFVSNVPFVSLDVTQTINQAGVSSFFQSAQAGSPTVINVNRTGRYIRVQLTGSDYLHIAEVQAWGAP